MVKICVTNLSINKSTLGTISYNFPKTTPVRQAFVPRAAIVYASAGQEGTEPEFRSKGTADKRVPSNFLVQLKKEH